MNVDKVRNVLVFRPDARLDAGSDIPGKTADVAHVRSSSAEDAKSQVETKSAAAGENVVVFSIGTSTQAPDRVGYAPPPQFYATRTGEERDPASTPF